MQFRRYANLPPRESNRHYHIRHPLLMDMAIHHFDLMRYVLGQEPVSVHCHAWNPPWSNFTEPPAAVATIVFDGASRVPLPALKYWDRAGSLAEFVDAVRSGREPLTSGRDNLTSAALMFAAMQSAETGQPISTLHPLSV